LPHLRELYLSETRVSEKAIADLRTDMPGLLIVR
jgi:hypothetical protein